MLGIGGAGLSGAARLLLARGLRVSGQDREASPFTETLGGLGVDVTLGVTELPATATAVVRSAAISADHPVLVRAQERGLPVLKYSELMGRLAPADRTLAVAGTHGKTSTSWMLHHALSELTGESGALVGGIERSLGVNAVPPGEDGWFCVEACEYDRSFHQLSPTGAIVTNLEADHLDYYQTTENLERAFALFVDRMDRDGLLVVGRDVPDLIESSAPCEVWRLGRELQVDLLGERQGHFGFRLRGPGWATPPVAMGVPGAFNVGNAAVALGLAVGRAARGTDPHEAAHRAAEGIARYRGAARRFELWGEAAGAAVVHDYAHHPTEVSVTLEAARRAFPGRVLHVLFQPHQHSRTARFLPDFVESLRSADRVVVADVYGARAHIDGVAAGADELAARLRRAGVDARTGGGPFESSAVLAEAVREPAAVLVLGAGDIDGIRDDLLDRLALRRSSTR